MKVSLKLILPILALLGLGGYFALKGKAGTAGTAKTATAGASATAVVKKPIELLEQDLVRVSPAAFEQTLPVSGSLRAVRTATVKSKLAGDVLGFTIREGEPVSVGQVIARIDDTEYQTRVSQAKNSFLASQAQASIAERQFESNKALVNQEFISKTALDTSLNNLQAARATRDAAKAALELAEKSLGDSVMRSPIAGIAAQRFVQSGEKVSPDARILEIVDLSSLELEAAVPANEIAAVSVGQTALLTADGASESFEARVARINPSTQGTSRTISVYLRLTAPANLRNGIFMQGQIITRSLAGSLAVPLSAVRLDRPQPYVYLVQNGVVSAVDVQLGARSAKGGETTVQILKGLGEGAAVVKGNVGSLSVGDAVTLSKLK